MNELANAKSNAVKAKLGEEKAYKLAMRIRGREEVSRQREQELEWKLRSLEEQGKMSDVAVKEYASLVRSLEAKMRINRAYASFDSQSPVEPHYASQRRTQNQLYAPGTTASTCRVTLAARASKV